MKNILGHDDKSEIITLISRIREKNSISSHLVMIVLYLMLF